MTGGNIDWGELNSLREMQDRSRGYVSEERRVEATVLHTAWRASMNVREVEVEMTVCHGHTCAPPHGFRATEALTPPPPLLHQRAYPTIGSITRHAQHP